MHYLTGVKSNKLQVDQYAIGIHIVVCNGEKDMKFSLLSDQHSLETPDMIHFLCYCALFLESTWIFVLDEKV